MAKYNKEIKEWVVPNLPRKPFYNVGDKISIHGQEIKVKSISPCHSVSGPIGCLLKRDEELPNSYFHFLGFQLYFDREINWFVGAKITSIRVIESGNEEALAEAVQMEGPVTVAIDHMHRVFQVMSIAIAML